MKITKHISILVQLHDCVVVPDLGAFVSNYVPASYSYKFNKIIPPTKVVVFNSKITTNDGLLQNHLVETENISYHESGLALSNFTDLCFENLSKGESIEFVGIGKIQFDTNGNIQFNSFHSENTLLEAYGLEETSILPLTEIFKENKIKYIERPAIRAVSSKRNFFKVAAAVLLFLSLSIPIRNTDLIINSSSLNPLAYFDSEPSASTKPNEETLKSKINEESESNKNLTSTESLKYILVGGNFQSDENASNYCNELKSKGFNSEIINLQNGTFRVSIESFSDMETALEFMNKYRQNNPKSQAWVSKR